VPAITKEKKMNASQKLKHMILLMDHALSGKTPPDINADNIDALYDELNDGGWGLQEARMELRHGDYKTDIDSPHSRHYEPHEVAAKAPDGSYIGWTYWTGGGKHSNPEEIDFVEDAYDVNVTEEQKMITVRTFSKAAA
jgi:hypothetical protein